MPKRRPQTKDYRHTLDERAGQEAADDDVTSDREKFGKRSKFRQINKTLATAADRMADAQLAAERQEAARWRGGAGLFAVCGCRAAR